MATLTEKTELTEAELAAVDRVCTLPWLDRSKINPAKAIEYSSDHWLAYFRYKAPQHLSKSVLYNQS